MVRRVPRYYFSALMLLAAIVVSVPCARSQQQLPAHATVLVNVLASDKHTNLPAEGLTPEDFEVFDGRAPVKIASFSSASSGTLRPITLWLVIQCPETHPYFDWVSRGSGFLRGKVDTLTPVLQQLGALDTVGVAHWCDDGQSAIDLLPGTDRSAPANSLNALLNSPAIPIGDILGENALYEVVLRMRDASVVAAPAALPVIVFFYGDHSGMHHDRVNDLLNRPLGMLPVVYGINNGVVPIQKLPLTDAFTQMHVVHFLGEQTGGEVLSNFHDDYSKELQHVLRELHGRYEIGFVPQDADGKRHELKVRFAEAARQKSRAVQLRVATEFLALAEDLPTMELHADLLRAMQSAAAYKEIVFDASGRFASADDPAQFRLYVASDSFSWKALENGDRLATLSVAIAVVSKTDSITGQQVKRFELQKTKAEQTSAAKGLVLNLSYAVPADADRVRFVLRDSATGRLGSFELPVKRIAAAQAIRSQ